MLEDEDRLRALADSELMDSEPEESFDRLTRLAARLLGVPVSLITLVDGRRQFFKSAEGIDVRETPLSHSFCRHVVIGGQPLLVSDARTDPRVSENLAVHELGVIAYCGVPLTTAGGHTLGSFCAIDSVPRNWSPEDVGLLEDLARGIMSELELRAANRKLAARELALSLSVDRLNRTLEHAPIGMALTAPDGRWLQVNRALCEILGYDEDELLGLTFQALTHPDDLSADLVQVQRLLTGEIDAYRTEKRYVRRSGEEIWVDLSVTLLRDQLGAPLYFIAQIKDISGRKARERALRGDRAALDDAQRAARVGSWSWDPASAQVEWSAGTYRVTDRHPELGPAGPHELLRLVHPADRERIDATCRRQLAAGGRLELEARIVPDGRREIRRLRVRGRPDPDRAGVITGTVQDVTELREAEREATVRAAQADATLAAVTEPCAVSVDGSIVAVNDALCELTGRSRQELLGSRPSASLRDPSGRRLLAQVGEGRARGPDGEVSAVVHALRQQSIGASRAPA